MGTCLEGGYKERPMPSEIVYAPVLEGDLVRDILFIKLFDSERRITPYTFLWPDQFGELLADLDVAINFQETTSNSIGEAEIERFKQGYRDRLGDIS